MAIVVITLTTKVLTIASIVVTIAYIVVIVVIGESSGIQLGNQTEIQHGIKQGS